MTNAERGSENYFPRGVVDNRRERQTTGKRNVAVCLGCLRALYEKNRCAVEDDKNGVWRECHIIPVKDGGDNTLENCGILCMKCYAVFSDESNEIDTIEKLRDYNRKDFEKRLRKGVIPPEIPPGSKKPMQK
ncbi:HNH endonuclease [Methanocorpusculum vombati]|uniref:HNH endonuclease n=1 Tax=Methanocorpusculum vombati TaxID=3002864 RepID=A0ABT4ILQ3_9EURY|nr:HNH endonuclease [Methanocorpusculum vombati]MCZ9319590.1 HNH endonuclease [Methanocorpusculum sp.]MCZ0862279.1 HNH endonuclease [Methanocorpusculum vombati]MDE2520698.1 HNH endonuclease [Methanocorpusculum sp.]MDE2534461.1 HNH endonuclease [Methanocorpusculum sp.]MDE2545775.1 HNH endonuclease [Methanocorpusculum sp.]